MPLEPRSYVGSQRGIRHRCLWCTALIALSRYPQRGLFLQQNQGRSNGAVRFFYRSAKRFLSLRRCLVYSSHRCFVLLVAACVTQDVEQEEGPWRAYKNRPPFVYTRCFLYYGGTVRTRGHNILEVFAHTCPLLLTRLVVG